MNARREMASGLVGAFLAVVAIYILENRHEFVLNFLTVMKMSLVLFVLIGYFLYRSGSAMGKRLAILLTVIPMLYIAGYYGWADEIASKVGINRSDLSSIPWPVAVVVIIAGLLLYWATLTYKKKNNGSTVVLLVLFIAAASFSAVGLS